LTAPINHEYDDDKKCVDNKLKSLQPSETWLKPKDGPKTRELIEEERKMKRMFWKTYWIHSLRLIKGDLEKSELSLQVGKTRRNLSIKEMCQ